MTAVAKRLPPPSRLAAATPVRRCAECNSTLEPTTNGNGAVVDRCPKCDTRSASTSTRRSPCTVNGCPGEVIAGVCACCAKRAAWIESHRPTRSCSICSGKITSSRNRKFCPPCAKAKAQYSSAGSVP